MSKKQENEEIQEKSQFITEVKSKAFTGKTIKTGEMLQLILLFKEFLVKSNLLDSFKDGFQLRDIFDCAEKIYLNWDNFIPIIEYICKISKNEISECPATEGIELIKLVGEVLDEIPLLNFTTTLGQTFVRMIKG